MFQSGFVNIIGKPNAGKSSLMNALIGQKLSIITPKAQTTRHRIMGIVTGENFQIVFSDTPGIIETKYQLHKAMMKMVKEALEDADVLLVVADLTKPRKEFEEVVSMIEKTNTKKIVALNKADVANEEVVKQFQSFSESRLKDAVVFPTSATTQLNLELLEQSLVKFLPQQPAFYDADTLTDRSERFFVSEFIREKILEQYQQEIPYATEVSVVDWQDEEKIMKIRTEVIVERESQKAILLGHGGKAIKQLGIASRESIERFLEKKVFLEITVKVRPDWRNSTKMLRYFGYSEK